MTLTYRMLVLLAGAGSAALFFGALGFQYIGGVMPCEMCMWQRWPHRIAIVVAIAAALLPTKILRMIGAGLGALTMVRSVWLAVYHTGVERHWWLGPETCTSRGIDLSASECGLLDPTCGTSIVLCDEIAWQMFGLTMANYNAIISLVLLGIWLQAMRRA